RQRRQGRLREHHRHLRPFRRGPDQPRLRHHPGSGVGYGSGVGRGSRRCGGEPAVSATMTQRRSGPTATTTRPGTAGALLAMFGAGLPVEDFYSERGSVLYDLLGRDDQHEIAELRAALRGGRRSVLELACGSGRLTLPLLADGHDVVGLENAPMMLRLLARRAAEPEGHGERLTLVEGDM